MNSAPSPAGRPYSVVGRYAIFDEIASGGMASVHLGKQMGEAGFSRIVAVKRLHPQFSKDAEFVSMFLDEARLAARIHHPNVVPTLDVATVGRELLLVMEYVHGVSFASLLQASREAGTRIEPRMVAAVVAGTLEGLHAAHEAKSETGAPLGVVHRDVSPQNVLVGVDGVPRILDFGVAKAAGKVHATRGGQIKGKLAYMSPEQVGSQPVTRQSDVFSAGVLLWEALMGRRLFDGENPAELVMQVLSQPIESPRARRPDVSEALDRVVMKALDRVPEARFATAREMAEALEAAGGLAPPREIARWVEATAGSTLATRRELVVRVEQTSIVDAAPAAASAREDPNLAATMLAARGPSAESGTRLRERIGAGPADPYGSTTPESAKPPSARPPPPAASRPSRTAPIAHRIPVRSTPAEEDAQHSLRERLEAPLKVVAVGVVLSAVDAVARPYLSALPVRPIWIAEVLVVAGVLWALARLALPAR